MSSTMKISFLALVSTAVAIPHYGANPHSQFHSAKAAQGTAPYGGAKPYPTGGWSGSNSTAAVAYPTGYSPEDKTTTLDETSTSTQTIYSTVIVKASSAGVYAENVPTGECGPATVTVTAKEKVTITVTPSSGADYTPAPKSSVAPVESKHDNGYGASSQVPVAEKSSVKPTEYPAVTPEAAKSTTPATEYPAQTPEASKASSSKAEYVAPSYAQNNPVVSASSATPSASATPSSGNTYSGAKRGLAYNTAELCKSFAGKFGFGYNWGQTENNDIGTNFIPMMHKPSDSTADEWLANVDKAVKKGTTAVMGFNECDHAEQCNLSPEAACTAWKSYMNPVKSAHSDITIIGPSVTNGAAPMGLDWLSRFHDCCPDAIVDATNIHFYDIYQEGQTLERFQAQIEKAAKIYGKPVWVTEFGLNPGSASSDQAVTFLKGAMEYMDNSANVQGYSWFMVGTGENQLNTASGLSPVGEAYSS